MRRAIRRFAMVSPPWSPATAGSRSHRATATITRTSRQMFARVEGMALEAFDHVRWDFETFPEFLRSREGKLGVNFGCYVGHSAVRRYVMGDASFEREASDDEITSMQALVDDAMRGGAMGFSSAQVNLHFDNAERPVPSRLASDREINALVDVVGRYGIGSLAHRAVQHGRRTRRRRLRADDRLRQAGRRADGLPGLRRTQSSRSIPTACGVASNRCSNARSASVHRSIRSS